MLVLAERLGSSHPQSVQIGFPGFTNEEEKRHPGIVIVLVHSLHVCMYVPLKAALQSICVGKAENSTWQLNVEMLF